MKIFYSVIDTGLSTPQPEQHELSRRKAHKEGGEILFYGAEEFRFMHLQPYILAKLCRTDGITDVVFFAFQQFCYNDSLNFKLMVDIISKGFGLHFARENLSFYSVDELTEKLPVLLAYFHSFKRRSDVEAKKIMQEIV